MMREGIGFGLCVLMIACGGGADEPRLEEDAGVDATLRDASSGPEDAGWADAGWADAGQPDSGQDPCLDGRLGPGEVAVDCGGACGPCPSGTLCTNDRDCDVANEQLCLDVEGQGQRVCAPVGPSCEQIGCTEAQFCALVPSSRSRDSVRVFCEARAQPGGACRSAPLGYPDLDGCVAGYSCQGGTCQARLPAGASCNARGAAACVEGSACDATRFGDPMFCRPQGTVGAFCSNHWDCVAGLACGDNSRCIERGLVGGSCVTEGSSCQGSRCVGKSAECDFPLVCNVPGVSRPSIGSMGECAIDDR